MCVDPATASLILGGVSAAASFVGSNQQANAQARLIEESNRQNNAALAARQQEEFSQASEEMSDVAREALLERARIRAASAEAGVAGFTLDSLLGESSMAESQARGRIATGFQRTQDQLQRTGAQETTRSRSAAAESESRRQNLGDLAAGLGTAYTNYKTARLGVDGLGSPTSNGRLPPQRRGNETPSHRR